MLRLICAAAIAASFSALPAYAQSGGIEAPMSAKEIKSPAAVKGARIALRSSLKDPDSAKIGAIKIYEKADGSKFACGSVNAKNSYGGYTGQSPFYVALFPRGKLFAGFAMIEEQTTAGQYAFRGQFPRCAS